jgi:predicted O-methyltransferase YrrM
MMIENLGSNGYESVSTPCEEVIEILTDLRERNRDLVVGEIGVGIGATTLEIINIMNGEGTLYLFDYQDVLDFLMYDINSTNLSKGLSIKPYGNSRAMFDNYAWTLGKMLISKDYPRFDLVYLDGAHTFNVDLSACACLKKMIKVGGYIVFDDVDWTFNKSPTLNPERNPLIRAQYTKEQLSTSHVQMVVELLFSECKNFTHEFSSSQRSIFKRVS